MNSKLLWTASGGVAVTALGAAIALISASYPVGTIGRMGPGYLPLVIGILMVVLGVFILIGDLRAGTDEEPIRMRPFFLILAGVVAWGEIAPHFGLVPATIALVVIVAFAQERPRPLMTAVTAVVLSFMGVAIFIWGLGSRLEAVRF
jgi:putative tricarboxylic transport membrane protein